MTNYKRFITYLYCYESGKKMGNVGFARVETSDKLGKVTIHCSTKVVPSKECKVYLLKRTKSMTISKQVAVATSQNGSLDIKLSFEGGMIDSSEFNLKDTQGIVILYSKDNYIAAKWDDSSVSYHEVISLEQEEEIQQPIPKTINTRKVYDKGEEFYTKTQVEAAQITKNEEEVSAVQPRVVMVDAADIVNLGNVSAIKKAAENREASTMSVESKVEESRAEEIQTEEILSEEIKADESKDDEMKEVLMDEADRNTVEINPVENDFNHSNLQATEVIANDNTNEKREEEKKSIKDIIRENIRAEKEKEKDKEKEIQKESDEPNESVKSEELIDADNPQTQEAPIDDTELKEENLHAANCAVPNPNLWADHPSARAILNRFVRMYPFDDGEIAECVRLEPKDIGLLPMSAWVLGNNSFLLHSYCNFRHLLFAKKLTREGCVYLLMVPGAHNNREQQLAKMFGFEHFKCSRRRSLRDGEFGYWYVTIVFD